MMQVSKENDKVEKAEVPAAKTQKLSSLLYGQLPFFSGWKSLGWAYH